VVSERRLASEVLSWYNAFTNSFAAFWLAWQRDGSLDKLSVGVPSGGPPSLTHFKQSMLPAAPLSSPVAPFACLDTMQA
jgi:hypothetical protein